MRTIMHIITDLDQGGAEGVLYRLVLRDKSNKHIVVSLMNEGYYGNGIKERGVELYCLNLTRGAVNLMSLVRLHNIVRNTKPDLIQTWLYHADLIGGLIAYINKVSLCWSIHLCNLSFNSTKFTTYMIIRFLSILSYVLPKKIIAVSYAAINEHVKIGYNRNRFVYIPIGFDHTNFSFDPKVRSSFRDSLNIEDSIILLGCVARWDLQKDHNNLLKAIYSLKDKPYFSKIRICLAGYEMDSFNNELLRLIQQKNKLCLDSFILLGAHQDINSVYNGIDLLVLPSRGESFPNVLIEGLLTNLQVISTDVGDVKKVLEKFVTIVAPRNSVALSEVIDEKVKKFGNNYDRKRLNLQFENDLKVFSVSNMIKSHNHLWECMLSENE